MLSKLIMFFRRKKLRELAKQQITEEKAKKDSLPKEKKLALASYDWVKLYWNGQKEDFLIRKLNVPDLIVCGKYPNVVFSFVASLREKGADIASKDTEPVDIEKMKKEEMALFEEIARMSMISPTFQEVYDSIIELRKEKGVSTPIESIRDVYPYDFLQDLFCFHMKSWEEGLKKNLDKLISTGSDASRNISV